MQHTSRSRKELKCMTEQIIESTQDAVTDHDLNSEAVKPKYLGCFKKSVAFIIDQIIIAISGIVIFFPFSKFIGSLYQYGWLPGYLLGGIYFAILESSILNGQSVGKMIFSCKVSSIKGQGISPLISFGRYFLITLPFFNGAISNTIASTVGITNTVIGGTIFLVIIGVLVAGNTLFMLFHPQKRGLHDIIFRTAVVPISYKPTTTIDNFTIKPVLSGIVGLVLLGFLFGNLFFKTWGNPDFSDINNLANKIQTESAIPNLSVSYRTFAFNGKQTMFSIEVNIPIPYDKFGNKIFTDDISNKLYPLVKKLNTNPKVDTITIVFYTKKYIGLFVINKTIRNSKKLAEIN